MNSERRRHPRAKIELSAEMTYTHVLFIGESLDLSVSGVRVVADDVLERGTSVYVTLAVPRNDEDEDEEPFEAGATVRWTRERPDGRCELGLQFCGLTAAQKRDLMRLLETKR